jgi:hypothetical protein
MTFYAATSIRENEACGGVIICEAILQNGTGDIQKLRASSPAVYSVIAQLHLVNGTNRGHSGDGGWVATDRIDTTNFF